MARPGPTRRAMLVGALAALAAPGVRAQEKDAPARRVLVVSRQKVLRETRAGRAVREAEAARTAAFQARVDEVKEALEAEEAELARLRGQIPRGEFKTRTEAFDRKVRHARRESQRRAAELQKAFREAREQVVSRLAPILIEVLRARDADIILDSEQILVAAPSVDVTEEVIALFDERVEPPEIDLAEPPPLLPQAPEDGG